MKLVIRQLSLSHHLLFLSLPTQVTKTFVSQFEVSREEVQDWIQQFVSFSVVSASSNFVSLQSSKSQTLSMHEFFQQSDSIEPSFTSITRLRVSAEPLSNLKLVGLLILPLLSALNVTSFSSQKISQRPWISNTSKKSILGLNKTFFYPLPFTLSKTRQTYTPSHV